MQKQKSLCAIALIAYTLSFHAFAATETESNNNFSSRNIFAPGVFVVDGALGTEHDLSTLTPDFSFTDTLAAGQVNSHILSGLAPAATFFAFIDNSASSADTMLGILDESNILLSYNDDGGPFADNYGSALDGQVSDNGGINLAVTGFEDYDFTGAHIESGDYQLNIYLRFESIGDVDFLSFTGLTPGTYMRAEISSANFDSVLGWFDSAGILMESDDDGGQGLLSMLTALVPANGELNFAVSGYPDYNFAGVHIESGQYQLTLTAVPIPTAFWLFGSGMLGLVGLGRLKRH